MTDASLSMELDVMDAQASEPLEVAEPASDPWLERRRYGFGASEIPALLVGLGLRDYPKCPDYITNNARKTSRTKGLPRIVAQKAEIVMPLAVGEAARKGTVREPELFSTWRTLLARRQHYGEHERLIVPGTAMHASTFLRSAQPLVDRHCHRLTSTLDGWARDMLDRDLVIECKCSASQRREISPWWVDQVQAQLAVTAADAGVLVCGEEWAAWHGNDGPIRSWLVERDERVIDEIREAVRLAWEMVEASR